MQYKVTKLLIYQMNYNLVLLTLSDMHNYKIVLECYLMGHKFLCFAIPPGKSIVISGCIA